MKLNEIMTKEVATLDPTTPISVAAQMMEDWDVGVIPICNERQLVGIITDRDIVIRAVAKKLDLSSTSVQEIMTDRICYCSENQSVEEAVKIMEAEQIRRLPIVNEDKHLIGIVSLADLAIRTSNPKLSAEALEEISTPNESFSEPAA